MPERLYFTDSDEANELIASDPMALLVGFALDQQVPVQKAFSGPLVIRERVGSLDAAALATADLDAVFRSKPAIHRYPGAMAKRVHGLAVHIDERYDGDAARVWTDAADGTQLRANLEALRSWRLRPRMLSGNQVRDLSVEVLGLRSPAPFLLAPVGVLSIAHQEAEVGVARASASSGIPMVLSSAATNSSIAPARSRMLTRRSAERCSIAASPMRRSTRPRSPRRRRFAPSRPRSRRSWRSGIRCERTSRARPRSGSTACSLFRPCMPKRRAAAARRICRV